MLLMLYTAENLDAWRAQIEAGLGNGLAVLDRLSTADMGGEEPFGFMDGVSQPRIDWSAEREPDTTRGSRLRQSAHGRRVPAGLSQ